jgi:hypothetical protein
MRKTWLAIAAAIGLALFGTTNTAQANHYCGGGYYGGYGGFSGGCNSYYAPSYSYGYYPRTHSYGSTPHYHGGYGHDHRGGVSINTGGFGFRYRW